MAAPLHRPPTNDVLASRAKVAVVVPATNTIVQPEFEAMRPPGVTNHVTRMYLPPRPYDDMETYRCALDTEEGNLDLALNLVLPCEPHVVAHGHSINSFRGDRARAYAEQKKLEDYCGVPFVTPSIAVLKGLEAIGNPRRIAVLTPYWPPADTLIAEFFTACGYEVVHTLGLKATGPTAVARITLDEIRAGCRVPGARSQRRPGLDPRGDQPAGVGHHRRDRGGAWQALDRGECGDLLASLAAGRYS